LLTFSVMSCHLLFIQLFSSIAASVSIKLLFCSVTTNGRAHHNSTTCCTTNNTTNGQKLDMSRCWAPALWCGKFVVELLWARPLVQVSVAGVRVVEFGPTPDRASFMRHRVFVVIASRQGMLLLWSLAWRKSTSINFVEAASSSEISISLSERACSSLG